jgi:molecular chaperone GrpE
MVTTMSDTVEDQIDPETVNAKSLIDENVTLRDRLLRALAETENVRRQTTRRIAEAHGFAITELARELLSVVDNLQRTVEAAETQALSSPSNESIVEGVQATLRELLQTLDRFGVRPVEAEDKPFDPNLHEAIMEVENSSHPPGTIARVLQNGYQLHDRLLRPARVVVTKRAAQEDYEAKDSDLGKEWASSPTDQE